MVTVPTRILSASFLALVALVASTPVALACGAFFPTNPDGNAQIGAQRALWVLSRDRVDLHLQLTGEGTIDSDFAWVFPIPAKGGAAGTADGLPTLALSDPKIFAALESLTAPVITIHRDDPSSGGIGCGSADKGGLGGGPDNVVHHFGSGTLGPYTWDILAGRDAAAVAAWLDDAGYVLPDAFADAIGPYLASSRFVAVRLTAPESGNPLMPLAISFDRPPASTLTYPLSLSRLSSPERLPFVMWTLADRRQRIANYGAMDLATVVGEMVETLGTPYNEMVRALTDDAAGRLVVTEFARDIGDDALAPELAALVGPETRYLTRLFGDIPAELAEDLVVTYAPNAPDVDPVIEVTAEAPRHTAGDTAGGPVLLIGAWMLARALNRRRCDTTD